VRRDPGTYRGQGRIRSRPTGVRAIDPRKVNKPVSGHYAKADVAPRRHIVELRTTDAASTSWAPRSPSSPFAAGQPVDVTGKTKGKGFAGVMKRHGFHGLKASHGVERKHRSPGSIGALRDPGRVFKGVRMAAAWAVCATRRAEPDHPGDRPGEQFDSRQGCESLAPRARWCVVRSSAKKVGVAK